MVTIKTQPRPTKPTKVYYFGEKSASTLCLPVVAGVEICTFEQVSRVFRELRREDLLVSADQAATDALLEARLRLQARKLTLNSQLLTIEPPRVQSVPALMSLFGNVWGLVLNYRWLPLTELLTVLVGAEPADRFIGGAVDQTSKTLTLLRGDRQVMVLPFAAFSPSGNGVKPDFDAFSITDYGHTIELGDYEASADAILYERDAGYRRRLDAGRRADERSFGASLRRLRLQRGLKQSDFPPNTAKTIARIERNEVDKPHGKTLELIAQRLAVKVVDIETF